jgi:hypothetical protein
VKRTVRVPVELLLQLTDKVPMAVKGKVLAANMLRISTNQKRCHEICLAGDGIKLRI